jgi:hypothetical protein
VNNARRPHDDAEYRRRRRLLMESVTPATRCWRCGKLAREHPQRHKSGKPATWHAGHLADGNNRGPLALEWSTCNISAGAALGAQRRHARRVAPHNPMHHDLANRAAATAAPCLTATGVLCANCTAWRTAN